MMMADPTFLNGSNQETSLVLSTTPITSRKECSKIEKALEEVTLMRVVDPKVNSHHQVAPFLTSHSFHKCDGLPLAVGYPQPKPRLWKRQISDQPGAGRSDQYQLLPAASARR